MRWRCAAGTPGSVTGSCWSGRRGWAGTCGRPGPGPETVVGLCLDRGAEMVTAILGTLAGRGGVPAAGPGLPGAAAGVHAGRRRAAVVAGTGQAVEDLPAGRVPVIELDDPAIDGGGRRLWRRRCSAGQLAYVIYTSGSTGTPKGVVVAHGGLANLAAAEVERFAVGAGVPGAAVGLGRGSTRQRAGAGAWRCAGGRGAGGRAGRAGRWPVRGWPAVLRPGGGDACLIVPPACWPGLGRADLPGAVCWSWAGEALCGGAGGAVGGGPAAGQRVRADRGDGDASPMPAARWTARGGTADRDAGGQYPGVRAGSVAVPGAGGGGRGAVRWPGRGWRAGTWGGPG